MRYTLKMNTPTTPSVTSPLSYIRNGFTTFLHAIQSNSNKLNPVDSIYGINIKDPRNYSTWGTPLGFGWYNKVRDQITGKAQKSEIPFMERIAGMDSTKIKAKLN